MIRYLYLSCSIAKLQGWELTNKSKLKPFWLFTVVKLQGRELTNKSYSYAEALLVSSWWKCMFSCWKEMCKKNQCRLIQYKLKKRKTSGCDELVFQDGDSFFFSFSSIIPSLWFFLQRAITSLYSTVKGSPKALLVSSWA